MFRSITRLRDARALAAGAEQVQCLQWRAVAEPPATGLALLELPGCNTDVEGEAGPGEGRGVICICPEPPSALLWAVCTSRWARLCTAQPPDAAAQCSWRACAPAVAVLFHYIVLSPCTKGFG